MTQKTLPTIHGTREFTGEYRTASAALAAARRLREENPDVPVQVEKTNDWTWKVTRVMQE